MNTWLRAALLLALVFPWAMPALADDSNRCAEESESGPPASLALTKGEITGKSLERVAMTKSVPRQGGDQTGVGYLVSGDQVEFVSACRGFSYVRYHGKDRTTTGWIDSSRLKLQGNPMIPLPANAGQLCSLVESEVNGGELKEVKSRAIPEGAIPDEGDPMSRPLNYVPVNVQGRPLSVVQLSEGGSCYSILAELRTADLKRVLSPDDAESRDPIRLSDRGNAWAMGLEEDVVMVNGQPLIRSRRRGEDFDLSSIDKTGDTRLVCHARLRPVSGKPVVVEGDRALCDSLAATAEPVVLQPAEGHFTVHEKQSLDASLEAVNWGLVDLDNTGRERRVGIVNYNYSSGGGCGLDFQLQFPLILNEGSVSADQAEAAFHALYSDEDDRSRSPDRLLVRVVRHGGQTYVEVLDAGLIPDDEVAHAPLQSVWKFAPSGPKKICEYRTSHYEVTPPEIREIGASVL